MLGSMKLSLWEALASLKEDVAFKLCRSWENIMHMYVYACIERTLQTALADS